MDRPDGQNEIETVPSVQATEEPGVRALTSAVSVTVRVMFAGMVCLVAAGLFRSCRIVKQHQVGWVFRFGAPRQEVPAGDHAFVFPAPIETFRVYDTGREKVIETVAFMPGKREAGEGGDDTGADRMRTGVDGYLLSADEHIVHSRAALYYRVQDPIAFHEEHSAPEDMLRHLFHAAILEAAAGLKAEQILFDVGRFSEDATSILRRHIDREGIGVSVNRIVLRSFPPEKVKGAFEENISAGQQQDQAMQQAEGYRLKTLNEAAAIRERLLAQAKSDRALMVESAAARAQTFLKLLAQYRESGDAMARELHAETIRRVISGAEETFLVDDAAGRELRLLIGRSKQKVGGKGTNRQDSGSND